MSPAETHIETIDRLRDERDGLRKTLVAAHDAFVAVDRNDLTDRYGYAPDEGPTANRAGETAPPGRRWFTPREIATQMRREIAEAVGPALDRSSIPADAVDRRIPPPDVEGGARARAASVIHDLMIHGIASDPSLKATAGGRRLGDRAIAVLEELRALDPNQGEPDA